QNFVKEKEMERFSAALTKLSDVRIRSQFPDISLSLKMLRDITKLRVETDKALSGPSSVKASKNLDEAPAAPAQP
ncbi:MAG: hypothetical protein RLZZ384_633, partial [Pseudomonadota bacterium]